MILDDVSDLLEMENVDFVECRCCGPVIGVDLTEGSD